MKIIYAGNGKFSDIAIRELTQHNVNIDLFLTSEEKEESLKNYLKEKDVRIINFVGKDDIFKIIEEERPDLIIVVSLGIIIPKEILQKFKFINIHPSLLPKYRGATPIQNAILSGEEETGISIFLINEKLDAGPIFVKEKVALNPQIYYKDAERLLASRGANLLSKNLQKIIDEDIFPVAQDDERATYTRAFKKEDGLINWNNPAKRIEKMVRGLNPWPGTFTKLNGKIFKILKADTQEQTKHGPFGPPGKLYLGTNNRIAVQTGKDFLLIDELQIEGKNRVTSKEFLQGNLDIIGSLFS